MKRNINKVVSAHKGIHATDGNIYFSADALSKNSIIAHVIAYTHKENILKNIRRDFEFENSKLKNIAFETIFEVQDSGELKLKTQVSETSEALSYDRLAPSIIIFFGTLLAIIFITSRIRKSLKGPVYQLMKIVEFTSETKNSKDFKLELPSDHIFREIGNKILKINDERLEAEKHRKEKELAIERNKMASQVAHDIRSPLTALEMSLKEMDQLPEHLRVGFQNSVQSIKDITVGLLVDTDLSDKKEVNEIGPVLISSVIEEVISIERMGLRSKLQFDINSQIGPSGYGCFANVNPVELKRVLSNLLRNAIEAIPGKGKVRMSLDQLDNEVLITIEDNGKGIPPEVINRIFDEKFSFDKEKGNGLGLYHAKKTIEVWNGSIGVQSMVGSGTVFTIRLPKVNPPAWFVSEIEISKNQKIVILDDDNSIHGVWDSRFRILQCKSIELIHFSCSKDLINWANERQNLHDYLYLCDYQLIQDKFSGLDVIENLGIQDKSILVTSHYSDKNVVKRCINLGVKIIPKNLAGIVPIKKVEKKERSKIDAVFIDDNLPLLGIWSITAKKAGVNLLTLDDPAKIKNYLNDLDKETLFYIDQNFKNIEKKGHEFALDLYKDGFKNLLISTGDVNFQANQYKWIKGVVSKRCPWSKLA